MTFPPFLGPLSPRTLVETSLRPGGEPRRLDTHHPGLSHRGSGRTCRSLLLPFRGLLQVLGLHVVEFLEQILARERDPARVDPLDLALTCLPAAPALGADGLALLQVRLAGAPVGGRLAKHAPRLDAAVPHPVLGERLA